MKKRFRELLAALLAIFMVIALLAPVGANAAVYHINWNTSGFHYAKPGDTIVDTRYRSFGNTVCYMKYGTDLDDVSDESGCPNYDYVVAMIHYDDPEMDGYSSNAIFHKGQLLDFYDEALGYEERGLTDYLIFQKHENNTVNNYAIPIKADEKKEHISISGGAYSSADNSATFSMTLDDLSFYHNKVIEGDALSNTEVTWYSTEYREGTYINNNECIEVEVSPKVKDSDYYFVNENGTFVLKGLNTTYVAEENVSEGEDPGRICRPLVIDITNPNLKRIYITLSANLTSENTGVGGLVTDASSKENMDSFYIGASAYENGKFLISGTVKSDAVDLDEARAYGKEAIAIEVLTGNGGEQCRKAISGNISLSVSYDYEDTNPVSGTGAEKGPVKIIEGGDKVKIPGSYIKSHPNAEYYATIKVPEDEDNRYYPITTYTVKVTNQEFLYEHTINLTSTHGNVAFSSSDASASNLGAMSTYKAIAGKKIQAILTPDIGYKANGFSVKTASGKTVNVSKESDTKYSFIMPDEDVSAAAAFVASYSDVKIKEVNGAEVTVSKDKATVGTKITIKAKADDGYKVTGVTVTDANKKAVTVKKDSSGKYYFTMPSSSVTVKATVKADPYIKLGTSKLSMSKGQTFSLSKVTTTVAPYDKVASYKSSKASVVAVDSKGKFTAKATGSAAITITTKKGAKGKITVNVGSKVITTTKVKVTNVENGKLTLKKGKTFKTETAVTPITSQDKLTFTSSKATVASVDSKGKITAKKAGKATITVTSGKQKASFTVTVK